MLIYYETIFLMRVQKWKTMKIPMARETVSASSHPEAENEKKNWRILKVSRKWEGTRQLRQRPG